MRHQLFIIDEERQKCNGRGLSHLYRLCNPSYHIKFTNEICDIKAIEYLTKNMIQKYKKLLISSIKLKIGKELEHLYASLVFAKCKC